MLRINLPENMQGVVAEKMNYFLIDTRWGFNKIFCYNEVFKSWENSEN